MLTQTNEHQLVAIDFEMFTPSEYSEIHLFIQTELHRFKTDINTTVWDPRLYENTQGHLECTTIRDNEFCDMIVDRMIERFGTTNNRSKYNIQHYRSQGQYNVNWHDDGSHNGAASIYLNQDWNRTLGGHFMYQMEHQQVMTAIQPKQGTAVYQQGGVLHTTTPVSPIAPSRQSIQVFVSD